MNPIDDLSPETVLLKSIRGSMTAKETSTVMNSNAKNAFDRFFLISRHPLYRISCLKNVVYEAI